MDKNSDIYQNGGSGYTPPFSSGPATAPPAPKKQNNMLPLIIVAAVLGLTVLVAAVVIGLTSGFLGDLGSLFGFGQPTQPTVAVQTAPVGTSPTTQIPLNPLSPGNPYFDSYDNYEDYVLPGSDREYYSRKDLQGLSNEDLVIAQKEILARHGEAFSDPQLQEYFSNRDWYIQGAAGYTLNGYEEMNLMLLDVHIRDLDGSLHRSANPYIKFSAGADSYAQLASDSRYLTAMDLNGKNKDELVAIRNEIFARHGYIFSDTHLQEFFLSKNWYQPKTTGSDFDRSVFNEYELGNVEFIQVYEKIETGSQISSGNPYIKYYNRSSEFILPNSGRKEIHGYELEGMTVEELCLARNEILARYGYTFSDDELLEYFLQCSWYRPSTPVGDSSGISLSSIERKNIDTIRAYEKLLDSKPDLSRLDTSLTVTVKADKFRVKVPAYWDDYAVFDKSDNGGMIFREKASKDVGYGGHVFSITTAPMDEDFYYWPNYQILGTLTDGNGSQYLVVGYGPTDVQFVWERMDLYNKMARERDRVHATIEGINGWTFIPA